MQGEGKIALYLDKCKDGGWGGREEEGIFHQIFFVHTLNYMSDPTKTNKKQQEGNRKMVCHTQKSKLTTLERNPLKIILAPLKIVCCPPPHLNSWIAAAAATKQISVRSRDNVLSTAWTLIMLQSSLKSELYYIIICVEHRQPPCISDKLLTLSLPVDAIASIANKEIL